jgi:hypothetical protein
MKTSLPRPSRIPLALAAVVSALGIRAQSATAADDAVKMPTYEVAAPKFTSRVAELYEMFDNLDHPTWLEAGGPLVQAIIWRHGYLRVHTGEKAVIYVDRTPGGMVAAATTIYTENGKLYANSDAFGAHVLMKNLTAADIYDSAKVEQWIGSIRGQYQIGGPSLFFVASGGRGRGFRGGNGPGFNGAREFTADVGYTEWGPSGPLQFSPVSGGPVGNVSGQPSTGQIVPTSANMFYVGNPVSGRFGTRALYQAEMDDHFHEGPALILDEAYRALHSPSRAGLVPVSISPVNARPSLVYDWDGVHYVYWPGVGTEGHKIPTNPVTGRPYLCVKDNGLMESVYFIATYLKSHPDEKAVMVASDDPSAAYTSKGQLCFFSPSLNHFAVLPKADPAAIGDAAVLKGSMAKLTALLAAVPVPAAADGRAHPRHVPEELPGDTADSQMRRIYLAFKGAGIPVHLVSGGSPSLSFTWQGVNYQYGPEQQLQVASNN